MESLWLCYVYVILTGVVERCKNWRCRGSNPGPFTCKANALPLSHIPMLPKLSAVGEIFSLFPSSSVVMYILFYSTRKPALQLPVFSVDHRRGLHWLPKQRAGKGVQSYTRANWNHLAVTCSRKWKTKILLYATWHFGCWGNGLKSKTDWANYIDICVLGSIVVSIPACHAGDRGSIPRRGGYFLGPMHGWENEIACELRH